MQLECTKRTASAGVQVSREAAAHVSQDAAAAEAAAAEGVAPSATNNAQLHAAQQLYGSMHRMEVRAGGCRAGLMCISTG